MLFDDGDGENGGDGDDDDSKPPLFSQIIWVGWLNARGKEVGAFFANLYFFTFFALSPLCSIYGG